MKAGKFVLILAMIFTSIFYIYNHKIEESYREIKKQKKISKNLDISANNSISNILQSLNFYDDSYRAFKNIDIEKIFIKYKKNLEFEYKNKNLISRKKLVPFFAIIEDDGYQIISSMDIKKENTSYSSEFLIPKIRFSYLENEVLYYYSFSGNLTVLYKENGSVKKLSSSIKDIKKILGKNKKFKLLSKKEEEINDLLLEKIKEQIVEDFIFYYSKTIDSKNLDIRSVFEKEYISKNLNKPALFVISNLSSVSSEFTYSFHHIDKAIIYGGFEENNKKIFADKSWCAINNKKIEKIFFSKKEAAKSGYFELKY